MANIIDHECRVCRHVVDKGDAYYFNFTTGQYRHRSCGLDQEGPREIGRERLVTPAPRAQQTPGPWTYSNGQVDCSGGTIATGVDWAPNGPLIAAAPDLLEACKAVGEWCDLIEQNYPEMRFPRMVRAAIAAATGGHDGV